MSYLRGPDRSEVQLPPPCLDDYVAANAPARFIEAYAEGLDFASLGFTHARPRDTGRPPFHPADLLRLYPCGYLHRIRSSRRLEAEAARNLEGGLAAARVGSRPFPDARPCQNARGIQPQHAGLQPAPGAQPAQRRPTPGRTPAARGGLSRRCSLRKLAQTADRHRRCRPRIHWPRIAQKQLRTEPSHPAPPHARDLRDPVRSFHTVCEAGDYFPLASK